MQFGTESQLVCVAVSNDNLNTVGVLFFETKEQFSESNIARSLVLTVTAKHKHCAVFLELEFSLLVICPPQYFGDSELSLKILEVALDICEERTIRDGSFRIP